MLLSRLQQQLRQKLHVQTESVQPDLEGHDPGERRSIQLQEVECSSTTGARQLDQRRMRKESPNMEEGYADWLKEEIWKYLELSKKERKRAATAEDNECAEYECEFCLCRFLLFSDFNNHRRSHVTQRPFSCIHCSIRFSEEKRLAEHLLEHESFRNASLEACVLCSQHFRSIEDLVCHLYECHSSVMEGLILEDQF